jgi:hypothetical protein
VIGQQWVDDFPAEELDGSECAIFVELDQMGKRISDQCKT